MEYLKGITHCTFLCRDYEKMVVFYRDRLGLKQIFRTPLHRSVRDSMKRIFPELKLNIGDEWMTYLEIAPRNFIELFKIPYKSQTNDTEDTGFHHICLLVDDIVEAAREMETQGIQIFDGPSWKGKPYKEPFPDKPEPNPIGVYSFNIVDPEGNQIEFMQYSDESRL